MHYRKKAVILVLSMVCSLLTLVSSVLGDTVSLGEQPAQTSQADQASQPTTTGTSPAHGIEHTLSTTDTETHTGSQPAKKSYTVVSWRSDDPNRLSETTTGEVAQQMTVSPPGPTASAEAHAKQGPADNTTRQTTSAKAPESAAKSEVESPSLSKMKDSGVQAPLPAINPAVTARTPVQPTPQPAPRRPAQMQVETKPEPKPAPKPAAAPKPKPAPKVKAAQPAKQPGFISRVIAMTRGLMSRAVSWLGTRYVWGGLSRAGVDCSGFTKLLFKSEGVNLPRTAKQQYKVGKPVGRKSLLPGDLVFFNTRGPITHVGVYIGNNKFIHAANPRRGVRTDSLGSAYYHKRYAGARRVLSLG